MNRSRLLVLGAITLLMSVAALFAISNTLTHSDEVAVPHMYTGAENHNIDLTEAAHLTRNYRDQAPDDAFLGGYFGNDATLRVMSQENCVGLRYYRGLTDEGQPVMIMVGVDPSGRDMIEGELAERILPCPPFCAEKNVLNTNVEDIDLP